MPFSQSCSWSATERGIGCSRGFLFLLFLGASLISGLATLGPTTNDSGVRLSSAPRRNPVASPTAYIIARSAGLIPHRRLVASVAEAVVWSSQSTSCWLRALRARRMEDVPPDTRVDEIVLVAPAFSRSYDLTPALRRVRSRADVLRDTLVLELGTSSVWHR